MYAEPNDLTGRGTKEIVLAWSWDIYTLLEGPARCFETLCALRHICSARTGVSFTRYVTRERRVRVWDRYLPAS